VADDISLAEGFRVLAAMPALVTRLETLVEQAQRSERQEWFTVAQAASYCGVTQQAIRAALKNEQLRKHTRGERSIALHVDDLDAWMGAAA